ncbi:carbohydrate ABC transporter permease [Pelagovum pacificum]|uniref:Sugar ABC transporter permease n=1 Tax=Pelagovum pacificum TaxID=2588711 RepID=A0A5C5GIV7_9RHOB|nr:sugar ABC transporter permease [Pelagovum pacificum]QQA43508.1 sugar ABC transporter permease [Pelagovum pacificum]TNY33356.1 sugar ABC transporter permease [Pelagovum pacificum]
MRLRHSTLMPQVALAPAVAITFVAFIGSILWTVYLSFTRSRRFPEYAIDTENLFRQYGRLFGDDAFITSLKNLVILGLGSTLAIGFGFILACLIDRERRGQGFFRTVFLYPLAISLIVTGVAWRWLFDPQLGMQAALHDWGLTWVRLDWLARSETAMYGIILASVWQGAGFYMALMLAGLKSINDEIWKAARLDGIGVWQFYTRIVIPMMKFTFLTCAILMSLGVVKAYDIVVAMTNGGPGQSTFVPAYFTINAYWQKSNLGYASAAATIMLLITLAFFLPMVIFAARRRRRAEESVT